jgi:cytidyltransferase-like protein
MKRVVVSAALDDLRYRDFRFIEEAAKLASLRVLLWSDHLIQHLTGKPPKFPQTEREYLVQAIRWVDQVTLVHELNDANALPAYEGAPPDAWAVTESSDTAARRAWCKSNRVEYRVLRDEFLDPSPTSPSTPNNPPAAGRKVVVTGCFDWFHSGHVRFFEEVSQLGDLYVVVGSDENVRVLKGDGHPLFPALQRRFIAGSIRYVKLALISSGSGWMDAEPEFLKIKPDIYAVNEDGDKPEKLEFCRRHGIEYKVLKRAPKDGLPRRQSTVLRGF